MRRIRNTSILVILFTFLFAAFPGSKPIITSSTPRLNPGSTGSEVKDVQQRLKNWGYYEGQVDGNYGLETFMAIKDFQLNWGLKPDGVADENTLMAMGMSTLLRGGLVYAQNGKSASDEQLLARAINGEARGEPYEGQVAVGAVILNRTRDSHFPKTVAGVIYQPLAFTAVADGQINVPIDPKSTVVKAARDALNGWDPTGGCLYYWNPATATSKWIWSRTIVKTIGKHHFGK